MTRSARPSSATTRPPRRRPTDAVGLSNYQDATTAEKAKYYNDTFKVDQNLGDRQRFFVRYSSYIRNSTYNQYFNNAFVGDQFYFYSKNAAFDHVYTLSPTMVLNTRYSYNRFIRGGDQPAEAVGFDLASLGFSPQYINQVPKDQVRFPRINLTGYISNGHTNENRPVNNHTVSSTLTKSAGAHSIRTGFEYRVYQEADQFKSNQQTGQFTFGTTWTRGPLDNSAGASGSIGQSVAELLLGLPDSGSITRQSDYIEQSGSWGMFVQDDWKVSPKLTVNVGLRYEFETPLHERFNRSTLGFDTSTSSPSRRQAQANYANIYPTISGGFPQLPPSAFALKGGMTFAGLNGNDGSLYNTPKNVFMPRLGIAYQLNSKTVLRSGLGMFAGFLGERRGDVFQNGFTQNTNMTVSTDNGLHFATTLANPFPLGVAEPVGAAAGLQTYLGQGFTYFNQNPKIPVTMRWEASLQHQFKQFLLEANYIGNKTNHIEITRNINTLPRQYLSTLPTRDDVYNNLLTATFANPLLNLVPGNSQGTYTGTTTSRQTLLSPFPAFGSNAINTTENTGYSWYHSFQFTASKRFSKGYTIQGSYTLQKWMQAVNLLNAADLAPVREISDSDAPHRINISSVWSLPFGKGRALRQQHQRFRFASGRRLGSLRHLEHPERIRPSLGQHDLLRQPQGHPAAARPADSGALVQRRQLRNRQRQTVARQPGPHLPVPLPHHPRTAPEQHRHRLDQADPHQRRQEPRVPCRSAQCRQPPVLPEPQHDRDGRAERQGHRLRADQRLHHEQLRTPSPDEPALPVLKPVSSITGADAVCPPLFLWTVTRSRRSPPFKWARRTSAAPSASRQNNLPPAVSKPTNRAFTTIDAFLTPLVTLS